MSAGREAHDPFLRTLGFEGFRGEPYTPLGWGMVGGAEVYLPVFIRNYFTKNWFDYYLKADQSAIRFTENPIEDQGVLDIRSSLSGG